MTDLDDLVARLNRLADIAYKQEGRQARARELRYSRDHPFSAPADLEDTPPPQPEDGFWDEVAECTRRRLQERFPELG